MGCTADGARWARLASFRVHSNGPGRGHPVTKSGSSGKVATASPVMSSYNACPPLSAPKTLSSQPAPSCHPCVPRPSPTYPTTHF